MSGSGFAGTITGGIQDVSALLPIIGTDQCEKHLGSALDGGYLYAAATPLSIFGSLGIVKAGVSILVASISLPKPSLTFTPLPKLSFRSSRERWLGARVLNNAGFSLSGTVAPLIGINEKRYKAETRLIEILEEKHIDNPEKLSVDWTSAQWNVSVILFTIVATALSVIPYIHLTSHQRVHSPWTYPLLRSAGSGIAVVCCQIIIQTRVVSLMKNRIIFMIINRVLVDELKKNKDSEKDSKYTDPVLQLQRQKDFEWDSALPSEECLWSLEQYLRVQLSHQSSGDTGLKPSNVSPPKPSDEDTPSSQPEVPVPKQENEQGASFSLPLAPQVALESANKESAHVLLPIEFPDYEHILKHLDELCKEHLPTITLQSIHCCILLSWILLLFSIPAAIIGYVGCFTLVTNSTSQNGPLIWLGVEAALSVIRVLFWAVNPSFDEKTEITLQLQLAKHQPLVTTNKDVNLIHSSDSTTGTILDLVPEHVFLERITPFTGPLEQFNHPQNIILYFTLSGDRQNGAMCLYMTVFDLSKRTAFTLHSDPGEAEMVYLDTIVGTDHDTGEMQVTLQKLVDQDHPRWKNHLLLIDLLLKYYNSLLYALNKGSCDSNIVNTNAPDHDPHSFPASMLTYFHVVQTSWPRDPWTSQLQWKWSLLPQLAGSESQDSIIPSPSLSEHNQLYLKLGYEHCLKTELMEKWGRWITINIDEMREAVLIDTLANWGVGEQFALEGQLWKERIYRELQLLESSMKLEEILYSHSKDYGQVIVNDHKDKELEEWLSSEFVIGQKKRLKHELAEAEARLNEARKTTEALLASIRRKKWWTVLQHNLPICVNHISSKITGVWKECISQLGEMEYWKKILYEHTEYTVSQGSMTALVNQITLGLDQWLQAVEEIPESMSAQKHLPSIAHWDSTHKDEATEMDNTIEQIRKADHSQLAMAYNEAAEIHLKLSHARAHKSIVSTQPYILFS